MYCEIFYFILCVYIKKIGEFGVLFLVDIFLIYIYYFLFVILIWLFYKKCSVYVKLWELNIFNWIYCLWDFLKNLKSKIKICLSYFFVYK